MDKQLRKRAARGHKGTMCAGCLMAPVKGSLHRCVRCAPRFELCQGCFPRLSSQHAHPFVRLPHPDALSQWEAVLHPPPPPPPGRQPDVEPTPAMQVRACAACWQRAARVSSGCGFGFLT